MFHVEQKKRAPIQDKPKRKLNYTFYIDQYMIDILQQVSRETGIAQAELVRRALEKEFNRPNVISLIKGTK